MEYTVEPEDVAFITTGRVKEYREMESLRHEVLLTGSNSWN